MENPLKRHSNINNNYKSNNGIKSFLSLTSSQSEWKSSNKAFNHKPIIKSSILGIHQNENEMNILETTNDKITDEPEDIFKINKEKTEGSLICKNRVIEPIVSLKNQNISDDYKFGKLSKYLLNNIKNECKTPIENTCKYKEIVSYKNISKDCSNNTKPFNANIFNQNAQILRSNNYNRNANMLDDARMKYNTINDETCYNNFTSNNNNSTSVNFDNKISTKGNYKTINNFDNQMKSDKENKFMDMRKTSLNYDLNDTIKNLNNRNILEYDENESPSLNKDLEEEYIDFYCKQNNNINFIPNVHHHIKRDSQNEDYNNYINCNIPVKKESRKIFCNAKLDFSRPLSIIGDKSVKTTHVPFFKEKNIKSFSSKSNLIVAPQIKTNDLNFSKNSSINKKSPLYTREGLLNFVNKAKMTVGKNISEKVNNENSDKNHFYCTGKLKNLYDSNKCSKEAFLDTNSYERNFDDCSRNYVEQKENGFLLNNNPTSNKLYYSEKLNFRENEIQKTNTFELADSVNFSKENNISDDNRNFKDTPDKIDFCDFNRCLKKHSFANSTSILNHLDKKEDSNMRNNHLRNISFNFEKFNSTYSHDIEYIIAQQRKKNPINNMKKNNTHLLDVAKVDERKISILINNNEMNSNTCSLNSEGIISGTKTLVDKRDDLNLCYTSNKIEFLKKNLKSSAENTYNSKTHTNTNNANNSNNNSNNLKILNNNNLIIENTSIDIISNYDLKDNNAKIVKIQSIYRGFICMKKYIKHYGNLESLNKLMNLFQKLSTTKEINNKQSLLNNLKLKSENIKLQAQNNFLNYMNNLFCNKIKSLKDYSFRKIYLFSFTKKISNYLENKQNKEFNKCLQNQKSYFLFLQKEKEKNNLDLKISVLLINFINKKLLNIKSSFIKQLQEISSVKKLLENKKVFMLKNIFSFLGKKSLFKSSRLYQKVLFINWKNFVQRTGFRNKIVKFMLENIINKKNKIINDEKVLLSFNDKKSRGEAIKFDQENIYYNSVKNSYAKILIYFNKIYIKRIDSENKSNKLMFILQKLIYNKQNIHIKILKNSLIKFRNLVEANRSEIFIKQKLVLSKLINFLSQKYNKLIEAKFTLWNTNSSKITKKINLLIILLRVKLNKNYFLTKTYFNSYRYKAKQITNQKKILNSLFNLFKSIDDQIKSDIYQLLIIKLKKNARWNSQSDDMEIVNINCSMTRESLENDLNSINKECDNIIKDSNGIQIFLIEKNFRFKVINYLWKLSNKNKLVLRYYFLKLYNRGNLLAINQLKKNSYIWSSSTFSKGNQINNSGIKFIEKEEPISNKHLEEQNNYNSTGFENDQSRIEGKK